MTLEEHITLAISTINNSSTLKLLDMLTPVELALFKLGIGTGINYQRSLELQALKEKAQS